jgi:hypothetical protein
VRFIKRLGATVSALALVGFLAAGLSACGSLAPATTAPAAAPSGVGHSYAITSSDVSGKVLSTYRITLDKVTEPAPPDPQDIASNGENVSAAPKGQHLAGVQFAVTGLTGSMNDSVMLSYSVLASDHHRYNPSINSEVAGEVIPGFKVQPGQTQIGSVTFVIPNGVHLTSVQYEPLSGSDPVTWNLGK